MKYKAVYNVDGGCSEGFGVSYPENYEEVRTIIADSPRDSMEKAVNIAIEISMGGLSNPNTGYTTVKLLSLFDSDNKELSQRSLVKNPKIKFEDDCVIIKCSSLAHILLLGEKLPEVTV